jgi:hypothetical protein
MTDVLTANTPADVRKVRSQPQTPRTLLPPAARTKLTIIQGETVDARDAAASASRRMAELRKSLEYSQDQRLPNAGAINAEIIRLDKVRKAADTRHAELAGLAANLNDWLQSLPPHAVLESVRTPSLKLEKNISLSDLVASTRDEIHEHQSAVRTVQAAPPPVADLKQAARDYVQALAQRGRPRVTAGAEGLQVSFDDPSSFAVSRKSSLPFLAWLHTDAMVAALEREIDALPQHPDALTPAQKTRRLSELRDRLDVLERREEGLVELAQERGIDLLRRPQADPAAVLGLRLVKPTT